MTSTRFSFKKSLLQRTAVAGALVVLCASASAALAPFTLTPSGVGLLGAQFTADNFLISDYATVRFGAGNSFTETGFLAISGVQSGGSVLAPVGLNTSYGLYIQFTGDGVTDNGVTGAVNPTAQPTFGTFNNLKYTLFGYSGAPAAFSFAGDTPTKSATTDVILAKGELLAGTVSTTPERDKFGALTGKFTPSANASLTFATASGASGFFTTPSPFYTLAVASFTNTVTQVSPLNTGAGFKISQGGGSFNFITTPVPEPETYALMLAGLFAVGFVARRRRSV